MKQITLLTGIITLISIIAPPASAIPLYIQVRGTICSISDADGDMNHNVGDEVTNLFLVNKELDGYQVNNTTINTRTDQNTSTQQLDYYFSDYIEGDGLMADTDTQTHMSINMGYDAIMGNNRIQRLYGDTDKTASTYTLISLYRYSTGAYAGFDSFNFDVGDEFTLLSQDGNDTTYRASVSVTLVSEEYPATAPVPEPASMLLFGLGLVALSGYKKILKP